MMSIFNRNQPLFAELTTEQAASIQGGFFRRLRQQMNKFKIPRILQPFSPVAKPIAGLAADSLIAKPIGKVIDPPEL